MTGQHNDQAAPVDEFGMPPGRTLYSEDDNDLPTVQSNAYANSFFDPWRDLFRYGNRQDVEVQSAECDWFSWEACETDNEREAHIEVYGDDMQTEHYVVRWERVAE